MAERVRANLARLSRELAGVAERAADSAPSSEQRVGSVASAKCAAGATGSNTGSGLAHVEGAQAMAFAPTLGEDELQRRLEDVAVTLRELSARELSRSTWRELRARLHPAYESLAQALSSHAVHVPSLRPTNISRSVFHVSAAMLALATVVLLPGWVRGVALVFFLSALVMETLRRFSPEANRVLMAAFSRVAHPHEAHRINSASWYSLALVILAFGFEPYVAAVAVGVLGFADPLAALVGRRFGRVRLVHGRSLEGTLTFVVVGATAAWLVLTLLYPEVAVGTSRLQVALGAAVLGGLAELFSKRLDDNLTVPVCAALGAWLML